MKSLTFCIQNIDIRAIWCKNEKSLGVFMCWSICLYQNGTCIFDADFFAKLF